MEYSSIREIEKITLEEAKRMAGDNRKIKGHDCFFVDLCGPFGYSVLVYKDGAHIYYADDDELHHKHLVKEKGVGGLKDFYIASLNKKLFTDEELMEPVVSYDEYRRKKYFLVNYWNMRYPYHTAFYIYRDEAGMEQRQKTIQQRYPYYNPVCHCYMDSKNAVSLAQKYKSHLDAEFARISEDLGMFREMVRYELSNHEACVSEEVNDALAALGLTYEGLPPRKKGIVRAELRKEIERFSDSD